MATKKLKGVCIGAGYFSHFQYEAWQRIPEVEMVAFSNRDPVKAAEITAKFGLREVLRGLSRDVRHGEAGLRGRHHAAAFASGDLRRGGETRHPHHLPEAARAVGRRRRREIVANAAAAKVRFMVHENFRFQPWHREIKRLINAGAIGDQLHSLAFRTRMGDGWGENAYIPRQPYFRDYPRLLVYETGVHFIDTFRFLAGDITRVTAWLRRLNPVIKGEDCGLLVFEFANGALGQWDANRYNEPTCRVPRPATHSANFWSKAARAACACISMAASRSRRLGGEEQEHCYTSTSDADFAGDCCYFAQRHFADCLLTGAL